MSDRTDSLLAELVELQRRQVANQEHAIATQKEAFATQQQAFATQQESVKRQRAAIKRVWTLMTVVLLLIVGQLAYSWFVYLSRR